MESESEVSPYAAKLREMIELTRYDECYEVFRSRSFGKVMEEHVEPFLGGAIAKIDPPDHTIRRKVLNRLTKRDGHRWFRDQALTPTIERVLAEELANPGVDGVVRTDLVLFSRRINVQLAAAIIGLTNVETRERADDLIDLTKSINGAIQFQYARGDRDDIVPQAFDAKKRFYEEFYRPSHEEHQRIVASHEAGQIAEADLPHNLMMLQVLLADPRWEDPELALRDAINLLVGVVDSTTMTLAFAFSELETWFESHPDDRRLSTEPDFLLRGVQESLRLHPTPASFRRAFEDVVLATGRELKVGQTVALLAGSANRDKAVFGADADRFDPWREVPTSVHRYGLAFGSGPHLCLGLPLVLGAEDIDGSLVHVLKHVYQAGARRDLDRPPMKRPNFDRDFYAAYPLILDGVQVGI